MPLGPINIEEILSKINSSDTAQDDVNSKYKDIDIKLKEEEQRKVRLLNEALEGENKSDTQDRGQRKGFAISVFALVSLYLAAVLTILFIQGFNKSFYLSDSVLITLLGTTTANVISILVIVVTYLFSRKKKH